MRQHAGYFIFIVSSQDQATVERNDSAGSGKGVDDILIDDHESEGFVGPVAVRGQAEAHVFEIGADHWVFVQHFIGAHLANQCFGVFRLFGTRQNGVCGGTHILQFQPFRLSDTGQTDTGHKHSQA